MSETPWSYEHPRKPGEYEFRCGELDHAIERRTVERIPFMGLWVECPDTGRHQVGVYHDALTDASWRPLLSPS